MRGALVLSVVTALNSLGNLFVHVLVARGGGVYSYGAVGALLSLGVIASTVSAGIQYAVARLAALSDASPHDLLRRGAWAAAPWLLVVLLASAGSAPFSAYLHLSGPAPVLLALAYCSTMFAYAVPAGIFIGRNRLVVIAALTMAGTCLRIGYGFLLGWTSPDGLGALASSALAMATVTAVAVLLLPRARCHVARTANSLKKVSAPLRGRLSLTGEGAVGSVLSAALWGAWSLPLLFARHNLPADDAGVFAAGQLVLSTVLLLTSGLATAFYPAIVRSRSRRHVLAGLGGTLALSLICVAAATLIGPTLIRHLYGPRFAMSASLLAGMGISVTAVAGATFGLWTAQALQRGIGGTAVGIAGALACEALMGSVARTPLALAVTPAISMAGGLLVATAAVSLRSRRRRVRALRSAVRRHRLAGAPQATPDGGMLERTVVGIMAHNEAATIEASLAAVLGAPGDAGPARVVVVASGCTDDTEAVVDRIAARDPRVELIVETARTGKASAINLFLRATDEPICVLVGADTLLAPGSLARLVAPFVDERIGMTGGRVVPTNEPTGIVGRAVHALWELHHAVAQRRAKLGEVVAFRRVMDRIDSQSLTDEVSLEAHVRGAGYLLQYVPEALVFNHGPVTVDDYLTHRKRIHQGHIAVESTTGYRASTMDPRPLVGVVVRTALRHPRCIIGLLAAVFLEVAARFEARKEYELQESRTDGLWKPIASAKQAFQVAYEYEVVGTPVPLGSVAPAAVEEAV